MKLKKSIAFFLAFMFSMTLIPAKEAKANEDMNIISSTNLTKEDAKKWAKSKNATETFIGLADLYWKLAKDHGGVNPAIAYVQAAVETGYGKFGGVIDESYFNPCGMKVPQNGDDTDPNAHYKFDSWNSGVKGHLDHLALYAGAKSYPRAETKDPKHFKYLLGTVKTVNGLSGKWATDTNYGNKILKLHSEMKAMAKKPNRMKIEEPKNASVVVGTLNLKGWALNDAGVKEVKAYVDGKFVKNLNYGKNSEDVDKTYPGYPEGKKSRFEGSLDLRTYKLGSHKVTIEVIGKDGSKDSESTYVDVKKNEKLPNKMWIETPTNNSNLGSEIKVEGWALNSSGIKEVKAYIDGKFVKKLNYGIVRNDVSNSNPGYVNGSKSGFSGTIDFKNYKKDNYVLKVEAIGNDGTIDKHEIIVNKVKKENKMWIETPTNNSSVENLLKINGWALNDSGVKSVKAYIDGKYVKDLAYGSTRNDVDSSNPGYYQGNKSGFKGEINLKNYKEDRYVLKVEATGNDGTIDKHEVIVNKNKKENKMWIDSPTNNSTLDKEITIKGWALNDSGVKAINLYLDGKLIKKLNYGLPRQDIYNSFPSYYNSKNAGFEGKLNLNDYPAGSYVLKVEALGYDGSVDKHEIIIKNNKVENNKLENRMWIDSPQNNSLVSNTVQVKGWALNQSGVKSVKAYINGSYVGDLKYGYDRSDVNSAYPGYANGSKSGYEGNLNISKYNSGELILRVDILGKDGSKQSQSRVIENLKVIDKKLVFDFDEGEPLPNNPQMLVLHHAEAKTSTVESIHNFHKNGNGWAGIGYHFYIRKDGTIYKGREENWKGAHAPSVNDKSLGICVEGSYMSEKMPAAQKDSVVKLGKYLTKKYNFREINRHKDVSPTDCPGKFYPFNEIKNAILN